MATPKERAINVRKTNFKIGFDNSKLQSDYQSKFLFLPLHEKNESLKQQLQKSNNYLIDKTYNQKNHFQTTNNQEYIKQNTLPSSMSKEIYEEITKSHVFISPDVDIDKHVTENKYQFQQKQIDTEGHIFNLKLKQELSKHADIFKDQQKNCPTIYQQSINKIDYNAAVQNKKLTNQIANNQKKDLKIDHIYFGFKNNNIRYPILSDKHKENQIDKYDNSKVNYKLGDQSLNYQSTNKRFEGGLQSYENILKNKEHQKVMVNYLRGSHFELGNQGNQFLSEHQESYHKMPFCQSELNVNDKICHIKFENKGDYNTVNQLTYQNKKLVQDEPYIQKEYNVLFGTQEKDNTTENRSQFKKKDKIAIDLKNQINQLKGNQIFQTNFENDWKSTMKDTHAKFDEYKPNNFGKLTIIQDKGLAAEIRKAHFNLGNQIDPNITSNKEIGKVLKGICVEDFQIADQLKKLNQKTNLTMGQDKTQYVSQYKSIHENK